MLDHELTTALHSSVFYQLAAILILAALLGQLAIKLRQPLLAAFIAVGLLAGPQVLGLVNESNTTIKTLAELGVTLLLFMVGLKLDIGLIKKLGPSALIVGTAQVLLTGILGTALGFLLGFDAVTSVIIGTALTFSSTIIVVKLLSDKRAIDSLYGKMALGILIVQDIVVILAMLTVTSLIGPEGAIPGLETYATILLKIAVLVVLTGLFVHFLATPMTHSLSKAPELMLIVAIGAPAIMAALCHYMDLSKELGGLLAGVAFASTPYHHVIAARLSALRDFLLLFFFVELGSHINVGAIGQQIIPALILSTFVLIGKPVIIMTIMTLMGYRKRTSFMTGLSLSQISEFSLIFAAMCVTAGLIAGDTIGIITLTALITIGLSSYAIAFSTKLHDFLEPRLFFLPTKNTKYTEDHRKHLKNHYDIIVFGLGRYGLAMAHQFKDQDAKILGVDFDPQAVRTAKNAGIDAVYGDAADPAFLEHLPLQNVHTVVFAFHHYMIGPMNTDLRRTLAKALREHGYKGHIAATSHHPEHNHELFHHGIDIVMNPFDDAALHAANLIMKKVKA